MLRTRFVDIRINDISISLSSDIYIGHRSMRNLTIIAFRIYSRAIKCVTECGVVGFTRVRGCGTWCSATVRDRAAMRSASHASAYRFVCMCIGVCIPKPPAHSVRACVHGRKCIYTYIYYIYMHDDAQCTDCAGAGAVDNPMGWSANPWKADRTNGDCEGWCHDDLIVLDNASANPPRIRFGKRTN